MFLKKLIISKNSDLVRELTFHKGVNLIIDETKTTDLRESGNNIGKTTILRLIDFCLGSDGTNIYQDKEFKQKTNTEIEEYLTTNNIVITLVLKDNIDIDESREVVIKRNFLKRSQKVQEINGEYFNDKDFPQKLKELIFRSTTDKPSFRQIIAKNIRDEKNRLVNTLKVLDSFTKKEEYEALFLFWFGVEIDENARKQSLHRQRTIEENILAGLRKEHSLSQIEQSLLVIKRTIAELEFKKSSLNLNKKYKQQLDSLNSIKYEINSLSTELGRLEFRKNLILESKSDLESELADIDINQVKELYAEAKALIPTIQIKFDDTLEFHNKMVDEKVKYITKELPELEEIIGKIKSKLNKSLSEESELTLALHKSGAFEGLESIVTELNTAYEKKGKFEELQNLWLKSTSKIKDIGLELKNINEGILSKDGLLQRRIAEFNRYFSQMSYELYGERFVLSADVGDKGYELNISSISGNLGTGKKKGQIAAFDLAYIQFADSESIECLHFILHDQIENVHDNQITLLIDIVNKINCQYVIPILRDKLPSEIEAESYELVRLSQSDKLFRLQ